MFYALSKIIFFFLRPSNALIFGLLLGWVLRRLGRVKSGTTILAVSFALLLAASFTALPSLLVEPLETRFPASPELSGPPTGIIVLGGALDTLGTLQWGAPQFGDGAERLMAGVHLARRFPEARLVYAGGNVGLADEMPAEAELAARVLEDFGIGPARLTLETRSRNTWENAANAYDVVQPQPGETWLLVTSAFHMPRAMGTFRAAGWTGVTAWPVDFRSVDAPVLGRQFASEGLFLTDLAVKEWLGLVAYRFAGYTGALFPAP